MDHLREHATVTSRGDKTQNLLSADFLALSNPRKTPSNERDIIKKEKKVDWPSKNRIIFDTTPLKA